MLRDRWKCEAPIYSKFYLFLINNNNNNNNNNYNNNNEGDIN